LKQSLTLKPNGFSIVETIVSLAIIALLAAGIITTVLGKTQAIAANQSTISSQNAAHNEDSGLTPISEAPSMEHTNTLADNENIKTDAEAVSRRMEHRIIQTAMDLMMVDHELQSVNRTSSTSDMSDFPSGCHLYPEYVREATSQYQYQCDSSGEVTQVTE
jgi:prepilin-type N-terminal cleavage/methylation domain-containing protein